MFALCRASNDPQTKRVFAVTFAGNGHDYFSFMECAV